MSIEDGGIDAGRSGSRSAASGSNDYGAFDVEQGDTLSPENAMQLLDIRAAVRMLARRRGVTALTVTILALGVGAATSVYSISNALLFRPLSFADSDRIVAVWQTFPRWRNEPVLSAAWDRVGLSVPEYRDLARARTTFEEIAIFNTTTGTLDVDGSRQVVRITIASASLLPLLRKPPIAGRGFRETDETLGSERVALVSYETWQARYGGDSSILGRQVSVNDRRYTVVGVLPPALSLGRGAAPASFWTVAGQDSADLRRGNHNYRALARLTSGVSPDRAASEAQRLLATVTEEKGARVEEWRVDDARSIRQPLLLLLGASMLLLVVACANVALLLLGEATPREAEIATRYAIGGGRWSIARQLLTEHAVLGLAGAFAGILLASLGTRTLVALAPPRWVGAQSVELDLHGLLVSVAAALGTTLLSGLAPMISLMRTDPATVLRAAGRGSTTRARLSRLLVTGELAMSVVLLVGAGLLALSLRNLVAVSSGFVADDLVAVRAAMPRAFLRDATLYRSWMSEVEQRLRSVPGVRTVTAANLVPFSGSTTSSLYTVGGAAEIGGDARREAQQRIVLPSYFSALDIPLRAGRVFSDEDREGAPLVAVISESAARRDWRSGTPIGARIRYQNEEWTIVGVVADVRYRHLTADVEPTIYTPFAQRPTFSDRASAALALLVRVQEHSLVARDLASLVQEVDRRVPVAGIDRVTELRARLHSDDRLRAFLIATFAVLAIVLAASGLYGVTARWVAQREREIGIRAVLGATYSRITQLIVFQAMSAVLIGIAIGLIAAVIASRALAPYLFGITGRESSVYVLIVVLVVVVGLAASWIPARRAASVAPAVALRAR